MKFLIFDAYGTLLELDDFYGRLQRGFAAAGVLLAPAVIMNAARAEMRHYMSRTAEAKNEAEWMALKAECAEVLARAIRQQDHTFSLSSARVLSILEGALVFRVFPEVVEVLEKLKAGGVRMGVLSNWDFSLHRILDSVDLSQYFSFTLPSSEVGIQKPTREFFCHALRLARQKYSQLKRRECYYIGDHYDSDVLGARGAGMVPIWLVREERDIASGEMHEDNRVLRIADLRGLLSLKQIFKNDG